LSGAYGKDGRRVTYQLKLMGVVETCGTAMAMRVARRSLVVLCESRLARTLRAAELTIDKMHVVHLFDYKLDVTDGSKKGTYGASEGLKL
jgi:hypothetical protein